MKSIYNNIEEAYVDMQEFAAYARGRLVNSDFAYDCVQDAFVKAQAYYNKYPGRKIKSFIIMKKIDRAALRYNKNTYFPFAEDYNADSNTKEHSGRITSSDMDLSS